MVFNKVQKTGNFNLKKSLPSADPIKFELPSVKPAKILYALYTKM